MNEDIVLNDTWKNLVRFLQTNVGKKPADLNSVLFLIGVQELGKGNITFSKEEKQDLIHIAVCKVLSYGGFYELEGYDEAGWPHWKNVKKLPAVNIFSQESLLKHYVIIFFKQEIGLHI